MNTSDLRLRWHLPARLVAAMVLALASALAAPSVHAERVIGPGEEAHVLSLFAPAGLGGEVAPGFRLMDVSIEARQIRLRLVSTAAPETALNVRLVGHDESIEDGVSVAESESFVVVAEPGVDDTQRAALTQLATRIRGNDDGTFWTEVAVESPSAPEPREGLGLGPLARLTLLAAAIAVTSVVVLVRRRRARTTKSTGKTD